MAGSAAHSHNPLDPNQVDSVPVGSAYHNQVGNAGHIQVGTIVDRILVGTADRIYDPIAAENEYQLLVGTSGHNLDPIQVDTDHHIGVETLGCIRPVETSDRNVDR